MMRLFSLVCAVAAVALPSVSAQLAPTQDVVVSYVRTGANAGTLPPPCVDTVPLVCDFSQVQLTTEVTADSFIVNFIDGGLDRFKNTNFNVTLMLKVTDKTVNFTEIAIASQHDFFPLLTLADITFDPDYIYVNLKAHSANAPAQIVITFKNTPGKGAAVGDPQISGFLGQNFQVHGAANTVYSVISSAKLQYNALFSFLSEGKCRSGTECFAHPGNYFGAVAMLIKQASGEVAKVEVTAGPVDVGMKVTIDGEPLSVSDKTIKIDDESSLHFASPFEMLVQTRDYTLRIENSDMFLNQQVSIRTPLLDQIKAFKSSTTSDASMLPHGILGQTWRRMSYANRWLHLEGDLMNYIVADGLTGVPSQMNRFSA